MSSIHPPHDRRVVIIGFGLVGPALVPLLIREFGLRREQIVAIAADEGGRADADALGIRFQTIRLDQDNYARHLSGRLGPGDWLINASVDVASLALIDWTQARGIHYLDTCIEPWAGGYQGDDVASTTNYELRRLALSRAAAGKPTAIVAHGANPGLISHLAKEGLLHIAARLGQRFCGHWGELAARCGVRVMQIAEYDSQQSSATLAPATFANTWSCAGFLAELEQRAEIGWGSHEGALPEGASRHLLGDRSAIYLRSRGCETRVRSWSPAHGAVSTLAIPHHEASSLAALFSLYRDGALQYRPTVYYAYCPAPSADRSIKVWMQQPGTRPAAYRVLRDDLVSGSDDLGVLFLTTHGGFWYGSRLSLAEARRLALCNSATSLQVAAGMVGALRWMLLHPEAGVVEAEQMDHDAVMQTARPYLGTVELVTTGWMPGASDDFGFQSFLHKHTEEE